jgi:hypothetical protein
MKGEKKYLGKNYFFPEKFHLGGDTLFLLEANTYLKYSFWKKSIDVFFLFC